MMSGAHDVCSQLVQQDLMTVLIAQFLKVITNNVCIFYSGLQVGQQLIEIVVQSQTAPNDELMEILNDTTEFMINMLYVLWTVMYVYIL